MVRLQPSNTGSWKTVELNWQDVESIGVRLARMVFSSGGRREIP